MELKVENVREYIEAVLAEDAEVLKPKGQKLKIAKMAQFLLSELDRTPDPLAEALIKTIIGDFEFIKKQGQGTEYLVFAESTIKLIAQYQKAKG